MNLDEVFEFNINLIRITFYIMIKLFPFWKWKSPIWGRKIFTFIDNLILLNFYLILLFFSLVLFYFTS